MKFSVYEKKEIQEKNYLNTENELEMNENLKNSINNINNLNISNINFNSNLKNFTNKIDTTTLNQPNKNSIVNMKSQYNLNELNNEFKQSISLNLQNSSMKKIIKDPSEQNDYNNKTFCTVTPQIKNNLDLSQIRQETENSIIFANKKELNNINLIKLKQRENVGNFEVEEDLIDQRNTKIMLKSKLNFI